MLLRCWLGGRKGIRPVKTEWWVVGMVICLERGADLHMAQLKNFANHFYTSAFHPMGCLGNCVFDLPVHLCICLGRGILWPVCHQILVCLSFLLIQSVILLNILLAMTVLGKWSITEIWADFQHQANTGLPDDDEISLWELSVISRQCYWWSVSPLVPWCSRLDPPVCTGLQSWYLCANIWHLCPEQNKSCWSTTFLSILCCSLAVCAYECFCYFFRQTKDDDKPV